MQKITSAKTSLRQVAAGIKSLVKRNVLKPGEVIVDVGGGRYNEGAEYVYAEAGAIVFVYDPFNRPADHNGNVQRMLAGGANHVMMNNVANVIQHDADLIDALSTAKRFMCDSGQLHISVYEGDGSGVGKATMNGQSWQRNAKLKSYLPLLEMVFSPDTYKFSIKDKVITVAK